MADKCKECGCVCVNCSITGLKKFHIVDDEDKNNGEMHLHVEIENLRQRLLERDNHIVTMETQFLNEADKFPNGELASMKEEILKWQDKYNRLYESHKRVQKVNQNLEDKLLRIVDKCETEKSAFTKDIATLSHRLADANYTIQRLTQDNEKYRNDVNLAIQLLQCKPSNFVGQRYDSLPSEVQAKVRSYVAQKRVTPSVSNESSSICNTGVITTSGVGLTENFKSITVPISTFPPTAMVYNVTKASNTEKDSDEESDDDSKPPVDIVSAAIMAKVLEERERERVFAKHCDTCTCHKSILTNDVETQTFNDNFDYRRYDKDDNDDNIHVDKEEEKEKEKKKKTIFYNNSEFDSGNNSENIIDNYRQDSCKDLIFNDTIMNFNSNGKLLSNNIDIEYIDERKIRKKTTTTTTTSLQYSPIKQSSMLLKQNDKLTVKQINRLSLLKKTEHQDKEEKKNEQTVNNVYRFAKTKSEWTKYEKLPSQDIDLIDLKNDSISEMDIDIINKRIYRNNDDDDDRFESILSSSSSSRDNHQIMKKKTSSSDNKITFDVINDRVWKKNNSIDESGGSDSGLGIKIKSLPIKLIEYQNMSNIKKNKTIKDDKIFNIKEKQPSSSSIVLDLQSEDTASPSFSSDSLLISSSDPPSTSSEFCNPKRLTDINKKISVNNNNNHNNNNNNNNNINFNNNNNRNYFTSSNSLMSNWQDRTTGPRGCSMRITPGSKNILLDNAGNYKTILYTSGTNNDYNNHHFKTKTKPLVNENVSKSVRSVISTSSDDNSSPILPNDNSQLQRVAEWIKASGKSDIDRPESGDKKTDDYVDVDVESVDKIDKEFRKQTKDVDVDVDVDVEINDTNDDKIFDINDKKYKKKMKLDKNFDDDNDNEVAGADLISFESSNDDIDIDVNNKKEKKKLLLSSSSSSSSFVNDSFNNIISKDDDNSSFNIINIKSKESLSSSLSSNNIDVKITREMEETYLKLAASLDPINLKLSNNDNTDITLEKYRKKYKKKITD